MIEKNHLLFREFRETDIVFLLELRNNIEIQELLLSRPRPNDKQKLTNWVRSRIDDDTKELFIITDKTTGNPLGFTQLNNIDIINQHAEFGVCVHPEFHNKGIFRTTVAMLEEYASNILNIRKLMCFVIEKNDISVNALYKFGFRKVGVLENHFVFNKLWHNVIIVEKLLF